MILVRGKKMKRKKITRQIDQDLLNIIFAVEDDWRKLRHIVDRSVDPLTEARLQLKVKEATYMFLLKEAKHRNVSALRY